MEGSFSDLTSFKILEKRDYEQEEKKYHLYLYTFTMQGYEDTYFGVISQPSTPTEISVFPEYFDYSTEPFSQEEIDRFYEAFLAGWEE